MTAAQPEPAPASIVIERRVEWSDTDAAGHHHFSAIQRWVEAAEAALLRRLDLLHLFGSTPRVHYSADFLRRLWFGESVRVELRVAKVGVSSLHYTFEVHGREGAAATGRMVVANSPATATASEPWPEPIRAAFAHRGPQAPETYTTGG